MRDTPEQSPDLKGLAADQVAAHMEGLAIGSSLAVDSSSEICDVLELLIPDILRREHNEWERESIDGFFFSVAVKNDDRSCELAGTCLLITDQTVTPFALNISVSGPGQLGSFRIRLGEPGIGPLGISGPVCTSRAARQMLSDLTGRLGDVHWVYDAAL